MPRDILGAGTTVFASPGLGRLRLIFIQTLTNTRLNRDLDIVRSDSWPIGTLQYFWVTRYMMPCSLLYNYMYPTRVLLEANSSSASQTFPHFMESPVSLPCSQKTATCPHPKPQQHSTRLPSDFFNIYIIIPTMLSSSTWSLYLRFPRPNPVSTSTLYVLHAPPTSFLIWSLQ